MSGLPPDKPTWDSVLGAMEENLWSWLFFQFPARSSPSHISLEKTADLVIRVSEHGSWSRSAVDTVFSDPMILTNRIQTENGHELHNEV